MTADGDNDVLRRTFDFWHGYRDAKRRAGQAILSKQIARTLAFDPSSSYYPNMNRDDAIARIKSIEPTIRAIGATAVYLFGSTARNEAKATSDVDIFIDYDPAARFSLIELIGMEHALEDALGTKVDLTTRGSLHPVLKADIEQSAIRVL